MTSKPKTRFASTLEKAVGKIAAFNRQRMAPDNTHPFLTGIHAPMTQEVTLTDLPVVGTIPPVFEGRYLRIGPNPIAPHSGSHHWFLGDGMVHGVALEQGRAKWYRNRWIRSRQVARLRGEPAAPGARRGDFDTVNTNVVEIGGRTWALVEAGSPPVELSDTLDGQTFNAFDGTLSGSFTAHPHRDPVSGEHHAITYDSADRATIHHVTISAAGRVIRERPVAVRHGPSIHDCALTERFVVILDLPVTFSIKHVIGGHSFPYAWNAGHAARVGLLPRHGEGDAVIWCDVAPGYVFHVANAFDTADGGVVMDVVAYDTMFAQSTKGPDRPGRLERWTIDPAARTVRRDVLDGAPQEFPRMDERRFGAPYRYCYTIAVSPEPLDGLVGDTRLYKHDLASGARSVHDFGEGRHPGEFVFVPAHAEAAEDEGYLIGLVVDVAAQATELVILDARRFGDLPVATIAIPHRIPPGFHGNWLPAITS